MKTHFSRSSRRGVKVFLAVTLEILLVLAGSGFREVRADADDPGYVISIQFENDFFGGGTDRHFSHGTRIECLTSPIQWMSDAADKLPWFRSERSRDNPKDELRARASFSLGKTFTHLKTRRPPSSSPTTGPMRVGSTWDSDWWPTRAPSVTTFLDT